jgi:CMP-N-acetylneuraminic acid synthetase
VLIATGSLYIFSVSDFLETGQIPVMGALPYIVSGVNTFDIDSEMDLKVAQELGKNYEF